MLLPLTTERRTLGLALLAAAAQLLMLSLPPSTLGLPAHTGMLNVHLLLELFAVVIATLIVTISWHTFNERTDPLARILIAGFLMVGVCDLVHALTFDGMPPLLGPAGTPRAIFFWLMGRTVEALTLGLLAVGWAPRGSRNAALLVGLAGAVLLVAWGSYGLDWFPVTFVPGEGVTLFKATYEVVLCLANVLIALRLLKRARDSQQTRFYLLALSAWIIGVGELSFASYTSPSEFQAIFGHVYKIAGYALLYWATYIVSLRAPFEGLRAAERKASDNEQRLRSLSNNLPDVLVYQLLREADGRMRFLHISEAVERLLGLSVDDALRDAGLLYARIHRDDQRGLMEAQRISAERLSVFDVTVRIYRTDGAERWMQLRSAPRQLDNGLICWDGVQTDITESRRSELRRQEHEATLAAVIHSASDAVISTNVQGQVELFNPAAERIFGHRAEAMLGQGLDRLLPARARGHHGGDLAGFAASGVSSRQMGVGRVQGVHADGSELDLEASISQVSVNQRQVLTAILRDVTERVRTERALLRYQLELTELTHRLMAQEKAANARLAQLLHDQLGQTLTAMRIDFVSEASLPADQAARHARVDRLIDQSIREVRQVLVELRPVLLDENGLGDALDNEIRSRQRSTPSVRLRLHVAEGLAGQRWSGEVEYAAFMVAREALANALQHANATEVMVSLSGNAGLLQLEIADNGMGMRDAALQPRPGHLGLIGMRERSIAIGGRFELGRSAQGGARVSMIWSEGET